MSFMASLLITLKDWLIFYYLNVQQFIHWPTEGPLGCLQFSQLWVSLPQTFAYKLFYGHKFSTLSDKCWQAQLLDCIEKLWLETQSCLLRLYYVAFSPAINKNACCFTSLLHILWWCQCFGFWHSNRCVMVSYCWVILHFLDDIFPDVEYLLLCFLFPLLYIFVTKVSV